MKIGSIQDDPFAISLFMLGALAPFTLHHNPFVCLFVYSFLLVSLALSEYLSYFQETFSN